MNYNYVVEENAILDYIAKEENHTLPMNPFTKYKKAMRLTKLHTASLIGTFGGIFLLVVLYLIPSGNEYIEMVKGGAPSSYLMTIFQIRTGSILNHPAIEK